MASNPFLALFENSGGDVGTADQSEEQRPVDSLTSQTSEAAERIVDEHEFLQTVLQVTLSVGKC